MSERRLSPFPVDPELVARMHRMEPDHVEEVCRLHAAAMGRSLWAELGLPFLRQVYRGLVGHPDFVGLVYVEDGRVRGFIAGSSNGPRMLRQVAKRRVLRLGLATAWGLLRRPGTARHLIETLRYFERSAPQGAGDQTVAESMFCSFEAELRGQRISGLINKLLFDEMAARGHRFLKITTEADNSGAMRQLGSWGFEQVGQFSFYGKEMLTWRLDLAACERVGRTTDGQDAPRPG